MRFEVGEIAIVASAANAPEAVGCECEITAIYDWGYDVFVAGVNSDHPTGEWAAKERNLKKLPPPNDPSSWEHCVWRPRIAVSEEQQ